ncbi:glycoside hydrolase family 6 protein [Streptosporangium sp. NPDC087985]|uniref:glycoside hydrolase family 6 protein n=1 Tax=Streptosporangium sp. NPDC087985 TaxID=3366196 RepID=UPI00380DBB7F
MTSSAEGHRLQAGDPRQVGPFHILSRLGQGGMGTVFLGRDAEGREVAVKVIHPQWATDPDFRRRFKREVAAAQRVARFCTAAVLDADMDGDVAYLATEYVLGPTLQEVVRTQGPLSGSSLEAVAVSVAVALQAIHSAGVIHRDLKPANVLLSSVGPKVIDFGIAQVAENTADISNIIMGTPAFMSPEQATGERLTSASDIFAWGALVTYAGSGRAPFSGESIPNILYRVLHDAPDISGLEPGLRAIVARALAKDPAQRPTAQQLLDVLTGRALIGDVPGMPRSGTAPLAVAPSGTAGPDAVPPAGSAPGGVPAGEALAEGATCDGAGGMASTRMGSPDVSARSRRPRFLAGVVTAAAAVVTAGVVIAVQIASAGSKPQAPAALVSGTPDPTTDTPGNAGSDDSPLHGSAVRLHVSPDGDAARQASVWEVSGRTGDAALMRTLAEIPQAVWLSGMTASQAARATSATLNAATEQGAVPVFVTDNIPLRACNANGAANSEEYLAWIDGIARTVGDRKAVFVLEPNSLAELPSSEDCALGDEKDQRARIDALASAVDRLGALPHTAVYLDGSLDGWPPLDVSAARLIEAGVGKADGFFLNAAGYQTTDRLIAYGTRLAKCVKVMSSKRERSCPDKEIDAIPDSVAGLPHFVIDTSRNGKGDWNPPSGKYKDPQIWCNPPGRGVGVRPTTRTGSGLADAYLWLRPPGMSDDQCTRGTTGSTDPVYGIVTPQGGAWWPELALQRVKDAVPPL